MTSFNLTHGPDVDRSHNWWHLIGNCLGVTFGASSGYYVSAQIQPILVVDNDSQKRVDWDHLGLDDKIKNSPTKKLFVIIINDGSHSSIVSPTAKKDGRFLQFMDKKDIVVIGVQGVSPSNVSALQKNHVQKHLSVT
eukprot:scpid61913/ scgid0046/ 